LRMEELEALLLSHLAITATANLKGDASRGAGSNKSRAWQKVRHM
jgi:hypothetical protein